MLPALRALDGEILAPGATVRVTGTLHALQTRRVTLDCHAGLTVEEMLDQVFSIHRRPSALVLVYFEGDAAALDPADWRKIRPKAGTTIVFRPVLQGALGRVLLSVAVAIASLLIAGPVGGFLGVAEVLGVSAATATAITAIGISAVATLALNALFPIKPPAVSAIAGQSPTALPSIAGAQNVAAPYDPLPCVLGRSRLSPRIGARYYTELVGDDQYFRGLFVWGYGPVDLDDLKIGETALTSFSDYEIEHGFGFALGEESTLYPGEVIEDGLSVLLEAALGNSNLVYVDADITWQSRTTAIDTDQISVDVTAPNGVFDVDPDTGYLRLARALARVEYRLVGAVPWLPFADDISFPVSTKTLRLGRLLTVARGQYEVRVGRANPKDHTTNEAQNSLVWTALRSFKNEHPLTFSKPVAWTAIRIKATGQLNGVVDTFNGIVSSLGPAFDGVSAWADDTASSNPADVFRLLAQGPSVARPYTDDELDIDSLQDWWVYCRDNGFEFNVVCTDRKPHNDRLADVAAAGRAFKTYIDGKLGVVWDRPDDPIVNHFTPRNTWDFALERDYVDPPHAWRMPFINALNGYKPDERIVYADGYTAANATIFETLEIPGITDPDLVWKHGRFQIAQLALRPERVRFLTNWRHINCARGDRVVFAHGAILIGQVSGLVTATADATVGGNTRTSVTLDEIVTLEAGTVYGIRFQLADGTSIERPVYFEASDPVHSTPAGDGYVVIILGAAPASADATLGAGDTFSFGEADLESAAYRVLTIEHQDDLVARVTLVDDAPAISTADQGAIPAYSPNVSAPLDPLNSPPQNLHYLEVIDLFAAQARSIVRLNWTYPRFGRVVNFEVQFKDVTNAGEFLGAGSVLAPHTDAEIEIAIAGQYSFRVRCVFTDGTVSGWALIDNVAIDGLLEVPDDVDNFLSAYDNFNRMQLSWTPVEDIRPIKYEIRKGTTWDSAQTVAEVAHSPWGTTGDGTYWIAAYISPATGARVYSDTKRSLTLTDSVLVANVVLSKDEQAEGFLGSFTGTANRAGSGSSMIITTSGASDFLTNPDFLGTPNLLNYGGSADGIYISPYVVPLGRVRPFRSSIKWIGTGIPVEQDFLAIPDFLANPDFLSSSLARLVDVYPVVRLANSAADAFAVTDIFAEADAFNAGYDWGAWQRWTPDVQNAAFVQFGMALETTDATVNAAALAFEWTVDVLDRLDRYTNLTIAPGGTAMVFEPGGYNTTPSGETAAFLGGSNGVNSLPHASTAHRNPAAGDLVAITGLTLAGCTIHVMNAGVSVGGTAVDAFFQGY